MVRGTLALLATTFVCTSLPQARQALTLDDWLRVVREHKPGAWDGSVRAVAPLAALDFRQLSTVLQPLLSGPRGTTASDRNAILLRGAVLHADAAMLGSYRQPPAIPGEEYALTSRDGRNKGQEASDPGWAFARRLLDAVLPDSAAAGVARLWYLATTAHMASIGNLADAEHHLEDARRAFPNDADVLCNAGWYFEELASPRIQAVVEDMKPPGSGARRFGNYPDVQDALRIAESYYTKALDADPAHLEARIRRGRVRTSRGRQKEAIEDLTLARASAADPVLLYYAELFLGGAYERIGQLALARGAYERASAVFPLAQSPHLGLSRISTTRGDKAGAQRELQAVLRLSPIAVQRPDPWWTYQLGSGRHSEELIGRLYAALPAPQGSGR